MTATEYTDTFADHPSANVRDRAARCDKTRAKCREMAAKYGPNHPATRVWQDRHRDARNELHAALRERAVERWG